jgi:hypothetical protein
VLKQEREQQKEKKITKDVIKAINGRNGNWWSTQVKKGVKCNQQAYSVMCSSTSIIFDVIVRLYECYVKYKKNI